MDDKDQELAVVKDQLKKAQQQRAIEERARAQRETENYVQQKGDTLKGLAQARDETVNKLAEKEKNKENP